MSFVFQTAIFAKKCQIVAIITRKMRLFASGTVFAASRASFVGLSHFDKVLK